VLHEDTTISTGMRDKYFKISAIGKAGHVAAIAIFDQGPKQARSTNVL
jgi:hypothetical protein